MRCAPSRPGSSRQCGFPWTSSNCSRTRQNPVVTFPDETRTVNSQSCSPVLSLHLLNQAARAMPDFFPEIPVIRYEGPQSKNPLAFKHYNPDEVVEGQKLRDL